MLLMLVVVLLAFLAGALLTLGFAPGSESPDSFAARLARIGSPSEFAVASPNDPRDTSTHAPRIILWLQKMGGGRAPSASLQAQIERAGFPDGLDARAFIGLRRVSALLFLVLAPAAAYCLGATLPLKSAAGALTLIIGLSLPDAWLQSKITARGARIRRALPDTLDLLVVSMEAGVGFDAAVAYAADAMRGPLPEALRRALEEMRLGRTRAEALRTLAARADVAELTGFIAAVVQADRLGSNLASTLRAQAETARAQRMQRIREAAAKLPTKMLFPLVFFLLPTLFVVLLGPGMINLWNALSH